MATTRTHRHRHRHPRPHRLPSGSSGRSLRAWAVAGAGWQGRSEGVAAQGHDRGRTPPGGDQRPIQACEDLLEGPLIAETELERSIVDDPEWQEGAAWGTPRPGHP